MQFAANLPVHSSCVVYDAMSPRATQRSERLSERANPRLYRGEVVV